LNKLANYLDQLLPSNMLGIFSLTSGIVDSKKERSKIKTNKPTRISNLMKKAEEREAYVKKF